MVNSTKYHLLSDLLDTLEADGFVMGTDKYLQLQELLTKLPDDLPLEALKTLLAPIFVTNRQDQTRFYELFDASLRRVRELEQPIPATSTKKPADVELWRNLVLILFWVLAGWAGYILDWGIFKWWGNPTFLLLIALTIGAVYFSTQALRRRWSQVLYLLTLAVVVAGGQLLKRWLLPELFPTTEYIPVHIAPGSATTLSIPLEKDQLLNVTLCNGATTDTSAAFGNYFVDSLGNITLVAKDTFSRTIYDYICVLAHYRRIKDTTYFVVQYDPPPIPTAEMSTEEVRAIARLDSLPVPFPRDIAQLQIDPDQQAKAEFYQKNAWWIKLLLIALFGAILWAIVEWRDRKRRRLVAQLVQRDKPPYIWNIHAGQREDLIFGDSARIVLNQLRRRRFDEVFKLDIKKTVETTVRHAGRIELQFKRQTSPPEYLLLIERHSLHDHRARLFEELYQSFKNSEINVVRFFYNGDPRLCFNRRYPNGLSIKELQHRFGDARLLLVGNGYELLNPASGRLSPWANVFTAWRERILFTPKPIATWDRREAYLGEHFYLMPASIDSLAATLEEFSNLEPRRPEELIPGLEDVQWRPIEIETEDDIITTLHRHYNEHMVQWIAACAVYPQLQWDITLFLGRELTNDNMPLLTLENLLKLTRLSWFVEGIIPDVAREELLDYLAAQGLEQWVRQKLHWLFEHAPAPSLDSIAYDEYDINRKSNEWRFTQNRSRRRELEEELSSYYAAGYNLDTVVFKYLDRKRSRLDFEAPLHWKKRIFKQGEPFFGLRDWLWATPLWALLSMVVLFFNPAYRLCQGERVVYQEQELCLSQASDYLLYYEYQIREAIEEQQLAKGDSLLAHVRRFYYTESRIDSLANSGSTVIGTMRAVSVDTVSFLRNLAVYYYNAGVRFYNDWQNFQDSIRREQEREQTLPQQQEDSEVQLEQRRRYQEWNHISDSLSAAGCENFRRGSLLFTNATQSVGYDFVLAMQKICVETPAFVPVKIAFRGRVTDAATQRPIAGATVKALSGNVTAQTSKDGGYTLIMPGELQDSIISVEFSALGYADRTESLRLSDPLLPVALEKLQPKPESVEIFSDRNGLLGLRTTTGRVLLPARYNNIELDPASGLYRVQIISKPNLRMGYVNVQGQEVIPVEYRVLGFLRDGLIVAAKERYGYLDRRGNIAISFIYEGASDFNRGEAEVIQVLEGQRFRFVINKDGRCIRNCPLESMYIKQKSVEQFKISENIEPISLYFDLDAPDPGGRITTTTLNYSQIFAELLSRKNQFVNILQQSNIAPAQQEIDVFFSTQVQGNFERFNEALGKVASYLNNSPKGQVEITLRGFAFARSATSYNQILSARRINAVRNSILNYNNGELQPYINANRLKITEEPVGDTRVPSRQKGVANTDTPPRNLSTLMENRVEVIIRFAN